MIPSTVTHDRRSFLLSTAAATMGALQGETASSRAAENRQSAPVVIDSHMHVWASDPRRYPFRHPYDKDYAGAPHEGTVEMLVQDMDAHGCTHAVLVQVIFHGWDNTYIADCVERFPDRFKAHGLIDPTDPRADQKLEFWIKERGLHGMRFSPIYYQNGNHGGDDWIDADPMHRVWATAEELGAVFNFYIAPPQLPRLAAMVRAHPQVPVVIDHVSQIDLSADDPEPHLRTLLGMARYPNVWVKISELTSVASSSKYPFVEAYPSIKRVYEAFGPDRLLFGTGYPGSARAAYHRPSLEQEIELIRTHIPFFTAEDRNKILGLNALRLWGFRR